MSHHTGRLATYLCHRSTNCPLLLKKMLVLSPLCTLPINRVHIIKL